MKKSWWIFVLVLIVLSLFVCAGELKVTEEHPFLINGEWVAAKDLKVGDFLTTIDGKKAVITNLTLVETKEPFLVYNIEAGKYHDFVVDGGDGVGIVVHNSNAGKKYLYFPKNPKTKPASWTNDEFYEYLLDRLGNTPLRVNSPKKKVFVGNQITHFEDGTDWPGASGAVFEEAGSSRSRVVKVMRGNTIFHDLPAIKIEDRIRVSQILESEWSNELRNMEIANRLGLRKFYGTVEVKNTGELLSASKHPANKHLIATRAYSMDRVDGGWPGEMKAYITKETIADGLAKYRRLYDEGYIQEDLQFLISYKGKVEVIDFEILSSSKGVQFSSVERKFLAFLESGK